jgi:hypothetical protein
MDRVGATRDVWRCLEREQAWRRRGAGPVGMGDAAQLTAVFRAVRACCIGVLEQKVGS